MKTQITSRKAFAQLVESGQLRGRQHEVLRAVIKHGPGTSAEIIAKGDLSPNVNLMRARFTELQARGLIVETGSRRCKVTGRTALVWTFTRRTKALDVKKGHRIDAAAWKRVALEAIACLAVHDNVTADEFREQAERMT